MRDEIGKKIKDGRTAKGWSQEHLASLIGTTQSTIERIENGGSLRSRFRHEAAAVLQIPSLKTAEIASEGTSRPPLQFMNYQDLIPVYASAEGGEGCLIVSHDEIGRAPRPHVLDGVKDAYAILITGTSMVPAYKPGDRAWVNPTLGPSRETDCILYAVDDTGEAKATIKEMVNWSDTAWTLRQHNPAKTFKLDRGVWITHHRVVGNFRGR